MYFLLEILYRGRKKNITVIKKRVTEYGGLNSNRSKWTVAEHYTVDVKYNGSDKIHTLACDTVTFGLLNERKKYIVIIKLRHIRKIIS